MEQVNFTEKLISGALAGITGTTIVFPIDSIKSRLQSGQFALQGRGLLGVECIRHVYKNEGIKGFYRGLSANLLGVTPEKAIKLAVNDTLRSYFARKIGCKEGDLPTTYGILSGAMAGFCQVVATNPMEIVKIQMQLAQVDTSRNLLFRVVSELGFKGLYRGTLATLSRDIPFSIIFFETFAQLKRKFISKSSTSSIQTVHSLTAGMLAGAIAGFIATPMDVVKTKLQAPGNVHSMKMLYKLIWHEYGIRGFFKGAVQRCMIVSPLFAISLFVYDLQRQYLQRNIQTK